MLAARSGVATALLLTLLLAASNGGQCASQSQQSQERRPWHPTEAGCMETHKLPQVLQAAAYNHTAKDAAAQQSGSLQAVMLTACNEHCLAKLFPPFIAAVQRSQDGDFMQHLVVVALGEKAYTLCLEMAAKHGHQCLLDRFCMPHGRPEGASSKMGFRSPHYFLALLQKVLWAAEVVDSGMSVMWVDLDIVLFSNPLRFFLDAAPWADVVTQGEYWNQESMFKGDVCKYNNHGAGCKPGTQPTQQDDNAIDPATGVPICCVMPVNGGLWMVRANPHGTALVKSWGAKLFEEGVVEGKMWDGKATLDQEVLQAMLWSRHINETRVTRTYDWDSQRGRYVSSGNITRLPNEAVARISGQRCSSACSGSPCGWMGPNQHFPEHWIRDELGFERQLVCIMPQSSANRLVSYHLNCLVDINFKLRRMRFYENWTVDEPEFVRRGLTVLPN